MERAEKDLEDNIENEFKGKNLYTDMENSIENKLKGIKLVQWHEKLKKINLKVRKPTKTWKTIENKFKGKNLYRDMENSLENKFKAYDLYKDIGNSFVVHAQEAEFSGCNLFLSYH